jgi:hypothetical protein
MIQPWLLLIVFGIIAIAIIIIVCATQRRRGWRCTERGCELVMGGEHHSRTKCEKHCEESRGKNGDDNESAGENAGADMENKTM